MPAWFAIRTRSRHEQLVCRELGMRRIDCFLPTYSRWSIWKDRRKQIDWPLFPGYCFARFDLGDRLVVLNCSGVVEIVSFSGKPAPIPDVEIDSVRRLVESDLKYDPCPLIREGMRVRVRSGPLKDVVGLLVRKDPHSRLVLSVELVSRAVSVQVDASDVIAI